MRVVLKENIENLGKKGDIVEVAAGYGRNYLIPKKLALEVTPSNMKMIEMEQQALKRMYEQERTSYTGLMQKINETRLTFIRKTGEKDHIFGSVSSADIKEALEELGMEVDKKKVMLDEPIKRLGNYAIPIKIFHEEKAEVKIEVIGEEEAASREKKEGEEEAVETREEEAKKEKVEEPEAVKETEAEEKKEEIKPDVQEEVEEERQEKKAEASEEQGKEPVTEKMEEETEKTAGEKEGK